MDYKQAVVVRGDLGMSRGKTCAQVAHAALSSAEIAMERRPQWYEAWKSQGQKKVVLKAGDEGELRELYAMARGLDLPCYLVQDAGLTELEPGTVTTLGIGPGPKELVDKVTGPLKLL